MSDFFALAAIGLHMGSVHLPARDYNDFNPGVYVVNKTGQIAGGYYNSQRRASFYLGQQFQVYDPVSVIVGAVTGYDRALVLPMVVPSAKIGMFRLSVVPRVGPVDSTAIHLSLEKQL